MLETSNTNWWCVHLAFKSCLRSISQDLKGVSLHLLIVLVAMKLEYSYNSEFGWLYMSWTDPCVRTRCVLHCQYMWVVSAHVINWLLRFNETNDEVCWIAGIGTSCSYCVLLYLKPSNFGHKKGLLFLIGDYANTLFTGTFSEGVSSVTDRVYHRIWIGTSCNIGSAIQYLAFVLHSSCRQY